MDAQQKDLIDLSDFAYQRLRNRLDSLTDAEYLWEPAENSWSIRPGADGIWQADRSMPPPDPEPLTTIAWRLSHIIDDVLADRRNATWVGLEIAPPALPTGKASTVAAAVPRLQSAYDYWRQCLEQVGELDAPVGPVAGPYADSSRRSFILHELDELIHHGAEVAVLRDLYRAAGQSASSPAQG